VKRKSVDAPASAANLVGVMTAQGQKPPAKSPSQAERDARLAKALRDNLRRRKAPPTAPDRAEAETPKAD
jgi:hypothetical protein